MDHDRIESLTGPSRILTDHRPLVDALIEIAPCAVNAIPGAEGLGLTMLDDGRTLVAARASGSPQGTLPRRTADRGPS